MLAAPSGLVFVVDDDSSVREALQSFLRAAGYAVEVFGSPTAFLERSRPDVDQCLVLDLDLPGLSGLELQVRLVEEHADTPIIFISAHGDIPSSVRAMKAGAVEFLTKPFDVNILLDVVELALAKSREQRAARAEVAAIRARHDALTPREREVMALVVRGLLNKQVAAELGVQESTVKVHRGKVMATMGADSLADLVVMAQKLK